MENLREFQKEENIKKTTPIIDQILIFVNNGKETPIHP